MKRVLSVLVLIAMTLIYLGTMDSSLPRSKALTLFDFQDLEHRYDQRIDDLVQIDPDLKLLQMSPKEKQSIYQSLDEIMTSKEDDRVVQDLEQIQLLDEAAYRRLLEDSQKTPQLIYFGFDECPFCKAFIPKLHHLAQEADIPIYYYDVNERGSDGSFTSVIETFQFDSVPQAFIVEDGQPQIRIDHHSSMKAMERFINIYQELVKE